jgi:hypothetical protein
MSLTPEELRELLIEKFMGPQIATSKTDSFIDDDGDLLEDDELLEDEESPEDESFEEDNESFEEDNESFEHDESPEDKSLEDALVHEEKVEDEDNTRFGSTLPEELNPENNSSKNESISYYRSNFLTPQSNMSMDIDRTLPAPQSTFATTQTIKTPTEDFYGFTYLDDDPLSRSFSQNRDYAKEYKITLVLYKINDSLEIPFLEFYFEKVDGLYAFPQKELKMSEFQTILSSVNKISPSKENNNDENSLLSSFIGGTNQGDTSNDSNEIDDDSTPTDSNEINDDSNPTDSNEIDDEFINQCSLFVKEKTGFDAQETYMGFLESADGNIYVFFNFTQFEFTKGIWGILDEIINKHRIADTGIKDADYKLFYENPLLLFIRDERREPMEVPISTFFCDVNGKNTYHNDTESSQLSISLIDEKIIDPIFKSIYLLSNDPIVYENLDLIKRYALFIKDAVYFLNKDFELTPEMDIVVDDQICASFYKDGKQFWAIKSVERFTEL